MLTRSITRRVVAVAAIAIGVTGCASFAQDTVLQGAVSRIDGTRVLVTPLTKFEGRAGDEVLVYQRIEQKAIDPYRNPWHPLKRVGTATVAESGPDGTWIEVRSGTVLPMGEIQLRKQR